MQAYYFIQRKKVKVKKFVHSLRFKLIAIVFIIFLVSNTVIVSTALKLSDNSTRESVESFLYTVTNSKSGRVIDSTELEDVLNQKDISSDAEGELAEIIDQMLKQNIDCVSFRSPKYKEKMIASYRPIPGTVWAIIGMAEGNKAILEEVKNLQDATGVMQNSMDEMAHGARKINETGSALMEIASQMQASIEEIGGQIDKFKV